MTDNLPPDHPIWEAWTQIKSAFPGPTANWEDEPPMIWAYAINELTLEQVQNGIKNLVHHGKEFPPSAGQFKDLCIMSFEWETQAHKPIDPATLLTKQPTVEDTEIGKAALNAMKGMFD